MATPNKGSAGRPHIGEGAAQQAGEHLQGGGQAGQGKQWGQQVQAPAPPQGGNGRPAPASPRPAQQAPHQTGPTAEEIKAQQDTERRKLDEQARRTAETERRAPKPKEAKGLKQDKQKKPKQQKEAERPQQTLPQTDQEPTEAGPEMPDPSTPEFHGEYLDFETGAVEPTRGTVRLPISSAPINRQTAEVHKASQRQGTAPHASRRPIRPASANPPVVTVDDLENPAETTTVGQRGDSKQEKPRSDGEQGKSAKRDEEYNAWGYRYVSPKDLKEKTEDEIIEGFIRQDYRTARKANKKRFKNERPHLDEQYTNNDDYAEGQEVDLPDIRETRKNKWRKVEEMMQEFYKNPSRVRFVGETLRQSKENPRLYRRKLPDAIEGNINMLRQEYGMTFSEAVQMIIVRVGLGIDSKGQITNVKPSDFRFTEEEVSEAVHEILASQQKWGHPFGLVGDTMLRIGGTRCYPLGYAPTQLLMAMTRGKNSPLKDYRDRLDELQEKIGETWVKSTYPTILANTRFEGQSQRAAIEAHMRAILALDGQNPEAWHIKEAATNTLLEFYDETEAMRKVDPEMATIMERRDEEAKKHLDRLLKQNLKAMPIKDEDGHVVDVEYRRKQGPIGRALIAWGNWIRMCGVAGDVPLIVAGFVEHVQGNYLTKVSNLILGHGMSEDMKLTDYTRDLLRSDEGKQTVSMFQALHHVGGMDALQGYALLANRGEIEFSNDGARKFLNRYVRGIEVSDAPDAKKKDVQLKMKKASHILATGGVGLRGSDANRFAEMLMINMNHNRMTDNQRGYMTGKEFEDAARAHGIGRTLLDAVSLTEGGDAFVSMTNLNLGRVSPFTRMIDVLIAKHGITGFIATVRLDSFLRYGGAFVENFMPFTNTLNYLAVRGVGRLKKSGENNPNQLGSMEERTRDGFLFGLKKCVVYDAARIGNTMIMGLFMYGVIKLLGGISDPEDERDKFNWLEYIVGDEENGKRYIPAWWMNDLSMWGMPLGMALAVAEKHPGDVERIFGVFKTGCYSMMDGVSVLDAINVITHAESNLMLLEQSINEEGYKKPENWESFLRMEAMTFFATLVKKSTPAVINRYLPGQTNDTLIAGKDAVERTASKVYDLEHYDLETAIEENRTVNVEDYEEQMIRSLSKDNVLFAGLMNVFRKGLFNDKKTGYFEWEMPPATMKNQIRSQFISMFEFDPASDDLPKDKKEREAFLDEKAMELIRYCEDTWVSPEEAMQNGFAIGYNARINAIDYCFKQIALARNEYCQLFSQGAWDSYGERQTSFAKMQNTQSYYYGILKKWFQNEDVPWTDEGYAKTLSDYKVTYEWEDGTPATGWDYLFNGFGVKKVYEPLGNHPTSFLPFTTVDDTGERGFNAETTLSFAGPMTDTQKIYDLMKGQTVQYGRDKGKFVNEVIFGGQGDLAAEGEDLRIQPGTDELPTIGYRGYVAMPNGLPDAIKNMTLEESAAKWGMDIEEMDKVINSKYQYPTKGRNSSGYRKNYRAWKSYGGSSRSTSYNPKIYSNSRNVNADRASGMNVRQPYKASTTYLRPDYETKGSREAYRRSDI